jgi:DNA-directed RNA polymerase subunit beta'
MYKSGFSALKVTLASVEDIEKWSHGSVDNPDTVNYRTGKPKPKWLFCEAIFGPVKNYECACGKYKGVRYKGIVCERCGVEVTTSRVRRERMWHIDLAVPVVHAWYKSSPSGGIHQLLNLSSNEIDKVLAFVKYVLVEEVTPKSLDIIKAKVTEQYAVKLAEIEKAYKEELESAGDKKKAKDEIEKLFADNKAGLEKEFNRIKSIVADLSFGGTIIESDYRNFFRQFAELAPFASGPDAILKMLRRIDVQKEIQRRVKEFPTIKSEEKRKKAFQLVKLLINLYVSGVKPENMIIKKLPVIPPDLRPVVQLEWGKFASSDVNLFYRRVLMRNIRLKKMIQVGMPDVVKKNEIRLLQESVSNLLVGEKAGGSSRAGSGVKVFKSLSDMLSGKEGIFRKNLLGKRVDYSGRSIITVGPDLKLNECGLPLYIAVKMFTPFIIGKLIEKKIVYTPKQAEKLIKDGAPIALKFLEEVIKDKYVLLNRAPTLHRLSIEAFKIRLMPGKTIRIHPLVCPSFNADFDGDQMAVHLPISDEAQKEARELIAADKNILKPGSGDPTIAHSQDMVLGMYYLTDDFTHTPRNAGLFESIEEVIKAYESSRVVLKDRITLSYKGEIIQTIVGRVVFNSIIPEKLRFINKTLKKKDLGKVLSAIFDEYGMEETVRVADAIKDCGFKYATESATSINVLDMRVPPEKEGIINLGDERANQIYSYFHKGFFTEDEKHRLIVQVWSEVKAKVESHVKWLTGPGDDMFTMVDSWARWSMTNTTQIAGMKWLVVNPRWEIIELPIKGSFVEWLKPIEYFISAHSGRKGKADTALRTAESGYLTRKLCDSCQEVIIRELDCGSQEYLTFSKEEAEIRGESLSEMIYGRVLAQDVHDVHGTVILHRGDLLHKENIELLENAEINMIKARNPLTCKTVGGVCQECYGMDLSTRNKVDVGTPVGVIAAQSIGEPATQLTMNTFHLGWVAGQEWDITQGIERITQLFEVRKPKTPALISPFDGVISFSEKGRLRYITVTSEHQKKIYSFADGYTSIVKKGDLLAKGAAYATQGKSRLKIKEGGEVLKVAKDHVVVGTQEIFTKSLTGLNPLKTENNQKVYKGEIITNGALDIKEYKDIVGDLEAQKYLIREVKKVYGSQGQDLNDKHVEVVVRQVFSKVFVEDSGDSSFVPGTLIKYQEFEATNEQLLAAGKKQATGKRLALGLTNVAKSTDSWLSAASFQETIRVMVGASLQGSIDTLSDLKSNVIIGRLLPVGEVYRKQMEWGDIIDLMDEQVPGE